MPTPSIVYAVHDPDAIRDYKAKPRVVREMVNRLVLAATGQSDVAKAWATLVSPDDKIGIKISAAGGELFTTHHDVVGAIVDGLVDGTSLLGPPFATSAPRSKAGAGRVSLAPRLRQTRDA